MKSELLKRLLSRLFPGVDGADDDVPPTDDLSASDPGDGDPDDTDIDLDLDLPDEPATPAVSARERLARLEAEVERRGRALDEPRQQPAPPRVDPNHEEEERRLRDPNTSEMDRWQIQANRTLRQTQMQAAQALQQAQDMADRTQFQAGITNDPRRAKYQDRVEAELSKARANGQNASREAIYYYMLGKDIAEGKLKAKPKAKAPGADVPRGRPANVRSDVPSRGAKSDHQKRADRLATLNI